MHFGAYRTDKERIDHALHKVELVDNVPFDKPEYLNWTMRPRNRAAEIGPEFRFAPHLQVERVMDRLTAVTGKYFDQNEIRSDPASGFKNEDALKAFAKTGNFDYVPGLRREEFSSDSDFNEALHRD